ncbi:probable ATP-dependent RNA helicase DDX52 [Cimex lectularius]|uniref:Probable ATP-dependent RNA helicase DDX52 n=1 Tax=Cimex lectularius TaxID=79782 RepID=A0A8I6S9U7_CIMLE|nr:probable ATP-dependent RNA helicase DDX52 [Cimex lectularius]
MDFQDIFRKLSSGSKFSKNSCSKIEEVKQESQSVENIKCQEERINRLRNINRITVRGKKVPPPIENFEQLCTEFMVPERILENIKNATYKKPTPIQMQVIPAMLQGRQIMACAPTGSGKTAAFLLPLISLLKKPSKNGFRALILCPTRELARQIFRECIQLSEGTGLKPYLIKKVSQSGHSFGSNFSKKCDILISTPNRLIYLMRKEDNCINLETVEWLIVDECDKLFEVGVRGFRDQLAEIYTSCDNSILKRAMFSATYTVHVAEWCRKNLHRVISITVGQRNTTVQDVQQELIYVGNEAGKIQALRNLIHQGLTPPVLVFVQSKERAKELFTELIYDEISVDVIHADRTQLQRDNTVNAFREGKIWVLICTDIMGRGIDFKGIKLVINYDFPPSAISYIHRIGRTGRAGRPGKAITYFTNDDKILLRSIALLLKESGCPVPEYMLKLKKVKRSERKQLETQPLERKSISTAIQSKKYNSSRKKPDKTSKIKKTTNKVKENVQKS